MRILIENGDMFDGTEEMLDDCFGVTVDQLEGWCTSSGWTFNIDPSQNWNDATKEWVAI